MEPKQSKYHHGDLRRVLISTAEEIIASQGSDAVTLRQLSRRIGVSHTAVYRHFKNKHELLCALALEGFKELESRFQKIDPQDRMPPRRQISAIGKAYIEFALENPARFRVMFGHVLLNEERTPELREAATRSFNRLRMVIERGQKKGVIRSGDSLDLTSVGWSMAHGITQLLLDGQLAIINGGQATPALITNADVQTSQDTKRFIDAAVEIMTSGLLKPGG